MAKKTKAPTEKQALAAFAKFRSENNHQIRSQAIDHLLGKQFIHGATKTYAPYGLRKVNEIEMLVIDRTPKVYFKDWGLGNVRVRFCFELARGRIRYDGSDYQGVTLKCTRNTWTDEPEGHRDGDDIRGGLDIDFHWSLDERT